MIFDQSGSLASTSRHDYLPFGEELFAGTGARLTTMGYTNADGARQKFTLKERDTETGLDYFGARYYASTQGRFTSPDPLLSSGRPIHPQSWNRYSYVINQPLSLIDPDGLDWGVANWYDKKGVHHTDYQWFNGEIGDYDGHSYTAVDFGGDASRTIDLSDGRTIKISNDPSNPLQDITAHPHAEQAPILPSSWMDRVPMASTTRSFFFNYTTHNFEGATVDFLKLSAELGTLPVVGEWAVGKAFATKASEAIFYSGGKAAFQAATEAATNEGGKTVGMTVGGKILNKFTESRVVWDWASKKFAQGASGEARVFLRQPVRLNSTWNTVEYPILRVNPFVRVVQR